jgi:hypothetical protein
MKYTRKPDLHFYFMNLPGVGDLLVVGENAFTSVSENAARCIP